MRCSRFPTPSTSHRFAFLRDESVLRDFRLESGIPEDRRLILYSGRLERVKRVDLLINAFVDLAAEMPAWDLVLAGSGSLEDDLRSLVPADLESRVHWLGWCDQDRLKVVYHASEILVLPSEYEPWAVVINEAIAAGLIPVASDAVGAAADLIEDGVSGYVFASGDLTDLKRAILSGRRRGRHRPGQRCRALRTCSGGTATPRRALHAPSSRSDTRSLDNSHLVHSTVSPL